LCILVIPNIATLRIQLILLIAAAAIGCRDTTPANRQQITLPNSTDFQKAEAFFNAGINKDSAFYYFTNVAQTSKDSLLVAMAYTYMAMIQEDIGDHLGSQESALEGLRHVNENNTTQHYCISSLYNELGMSSVSLKNYDDALEYYDLALKFQQDQGYREIFENNKAVAYRDKKDYKHAIAILNSIINKQKDHNSDYARTLSNLANVKWLANPAYYPVPDLLRALDIRFRENNDIGIAASYNHLSDYYIANNSDSALFYAQAMYHLGQKINNAEEKLNALPKLISLSAPAQSKTYFSEYQTLNDSIITSRNKAKNQFALIRYRSEKNKAENLRLQQDNARQELKIFRQWVWIYSIIAVVVIAAVFFNRWLRRKRRQLQLKSQEAIRENHLKTSQKVHDTVANGLYRLMNSIEHNEQVKKEALLNSLEELYERSRDISYEPALHCSSPDERINELLTGFATPQLKVGVVGNSKRIWHALDPEAIAALEQVLQELMVNMSRHSKAQYVVVRFDLAEGAVTVSYRDDGIGFKPGFQPGNGLKSTGNRIRALGGELIFTTQNTTGAAISITIPISNT